MRGNKMNGFNGEFKSSFLSCEKDTESIIRKLFVDSKPHSDMLKRLLLINTPDCLNDMTNQVYIDKIKNTSIKDLREQGYIRLEPKIKLNEHEEVKSYIVISFDNFVPNANNHKFRDCIIRFDILCNVRNWDLGNYRLRPLKIAGYIDGILNESRLSGIGTLNFAGCQMGNYGENLSGYTLMYYAIHGSDDEIPKQEVI
jgi:hypothetical protein